MTSDYKVIDRETRDTAKTRLGLGGRAERKMRQLHNKLTF